MTKRRLRQIQTLMKDAATFLRLKMKPQGATVKQLLVQFENPNIYHRYFYLLLKFYKIAGYTIYYPMGFQKFRNLRNGEPYLSLILKEKDFLSIKNPPKSSEAILLRDDDFSADYFADHFARRSESGFHLPMNFHPLMYHQNLWNEKIDTEKHRINSVFFYGNFDDEAYRDIEKTPFDILGRMQILEILQPQENFISVKSQSQLNQLISAKPDGKLIFAIKEQYMVPIEKVRETLSHFRFFLCCPGVIVPLCHNFAEAISVGTVPVLQAEYARVVYPELRHLENAVIFEDEADLFKKLDEIFKMSQDDFSNMRRNVLEYYSRHYTPENVLKKVNAAIGKKTIFLNGNHRKLKAAIQRNNFEPQAQDWIVKPWQNNAQ